MSNYQIQHINKRLKYLVKCVYHLYRPLVNAFTNPSTKHSCAKKYHTNNYYLLSAHHMLSAHHNINKKKVQRTIQRFIGITSFKFFPYFQFKLNVRANVREKKSISIQGLEFNDLAMSHHQLLFVKLICSIIYN